MSRYLSCAAILTLGTLTVGCAIKGPSTEPGGDGDPVENDGAPEIGGGDEADDAPEGEEPGPADGGDGTGGSDDPGDDTGGDPGGSDPQPPQADFTTQVCYPGADGNNNTCVPIVARYPGFPSAYNYPSSSALAYQSPVRFIDLNAVSSSTMLAPNFALSELMQAHKGRYALFQPHTVSTLQSMRNQSGGALLIHSAYRNPSYNAGVGGATFSRHMYGDAIDMHSAVISLNALKSLCQSHGADYVSVYNTHVHCDWRYAGNNASFFGTSPMQFGEPNSDEAFNEAANVAHHADGTLTAHIDGFDEGEPYREWTSFNTRGQRIETVAGESYVPPSHADTIEVVVGGRVALRIDAKGTHETIRLPDAEVQLRLDTLSVPDLVEHNHD